MKYKNFLTILMNYKKCQEKITELYDIGFNIFDGKYELISNIEPIIDASFNSIYNEDGVDWINWFIYENEYGKKDWSDTPIFKDGELIERDPVDSYGAKDKDGNPIAYSYESLYNMLEKDYKL